MRRTAHADALLLILGAGACASQPTTVIDLTAMGLGGAPEVLRLGRGSLAAIGLQP